MAIVRSEYDALAGRKRTGFDGVVGSELPTEAAVGRVETVEAAVVASDEYQHSGRVAAGRRFYPLRQFGRPFFYSAF